MPEQPQDYNWKESILSILQGDEIKVKKLRKQVLISLQLDEDDKVAKKSFKRTVQELEDSGEISIDSEGLVKLSEKSLKRKAKEEKKSKKKKKKRKSSDADEVTLREPKEESLSDDQQESITPNEANKNKPCTGNPQGVTRLFMGNLPFAVDETSLGEFLKDKVTHIKWITDKETGKFYGSAFVEMLDSVAASEAVAMAGQKLMGRPIKVNFAPARQGDVWPPEKKVVTGGQSAGGGDSGKGGGSSQPKEMSEKPEHCVKLFIGNLSYDIDDDGIAKFFGNVDAEVKAVRWLHHKDSGDFKGCGFVEFWSTEACDKAASLNGKNLLGRPIRIDWTD